MRLIPKSLLLWLCLMVGAAASERPVDDLRHGLLWRDSPLSAQFPLVIRTPAGAWFYLRLEDAETGHVVLAAGIEGGRFFRVLVPNGRYVVDLSHGRDWQRAGFAPGADTGRLRIETPLDFAVGGVARKEGHVVTLSESPDGYDVSVHGQAICQRITTRAVPRLPGDTSVPDIDLDGAIPSNDLYRPLRDLPIGSRRVPAPWIVTGIRRVVCD